MNELEDLMSEEELIDYLKKELPWLNEFDDITAKLQEVQENDQRPPRESIQSIDEGMNSLREFQKKCMQEIKDHQEWYMRVRAVLHTMNVVKKVHNEFQKTRLLMNLFLLAEPKNE